MAGDFAAKIKAYAVPMILFSLAMLYQLVLLPRSFPPSHYDVLGIKTYSSMETVKEAYENLQSKWNSGLEVPTTTEFVKIQYAYELLTNPIWKRNYDVFGIDEQLHVLEKVSQLYAGEKFSNIELPLLHADISDTEDDAFNVITSKEFQSMFQDSKPWLLQVYSSGSNHSAEFANPWKRIAALLNGVANIGMVELGEIQIAAYLAERKPTGQLFFRNGLPSVVAFPSGCKTSDCLIRFEGELSVDAVTDWFAAAVLNLPRIFYYSKESLGPRFLAKSSPHKVKVILFSKTGERATPVVRQAAKAYWNYATFACVLWREEELSVWWTAFGVESVPAVVFLKDPGLKPLVYHGSVNDSWFLDVLEQNKQQELPQLRSLTSEELGCNARGYSHAGRDTMIWYCAILAGRMGPELDSMRETMRRVQETLSKSGELNAASEDQHSITAAIALKNKRLTLSWLDGEVQKRVKTPELVPEDAEPFWSRGQQGILSKSLGAKAKIQGIMIRLYDYLGDPRIGPALLLGSLMSFGTIWLMRSQQNRAFQSSQPSQTDNNDKPRPRERRRARNVSNNDLPPSITNLEPRDSYQMSLSDSD
ncbi:uncharacterized protein LOC111289319 isoform X4 [Durio zibethinus]|uniref:Uncharacterized protein LOC111289319 isoform X4 n=1 Tax=Durio zibethinus TaxID=66656 RepID=A0A6P5Y6D3_DURZI|nr:uncharacterized protein LOC111289319 isoform X4 [Durio zibethinus]